SYLDRDPAIAIGIFQRPGSNALSTATNIKKTMDELAKRFPPSVKYDTIYNPTEFIQQSVDAVEETIAEAIILVVLVVILFLQTWRAAIIPIVAIPVSLIGTFFFMAMFGFSLNNLSLFGLVLAIGIVVDHGIVWGGKVGGKYAPPAPPLAPRRRAQKHGRGGLGPDRHRSRAVRGVRAGGLHHGHLRPILPPVRAHHRRGDADIPHRLAHPLARALRTAPQ